MKVLGYLAMIILGYWATTRLLFGWYHLFRGHFFGWYPYYVIEIFDLVECAVALILLWEIATYLIKGQYCRGG